MAGRILKLSHRSLLSLKGNDVMQFLQAITTNDIRRLAENGTQYTLMLNSRGRIVEDLLLYRRGSDVLLESEKSNISRLRRLLDMYKIHKDVTIEEYSGSVFFAENTNSDGFNDPRVESFGKRIIADKAPDGADGSEALYSEKRFQVGIPEGASETAGELPLYMNADILNGISGNKGCYIGQELTTRALHAPQIKKRVLPFCCSGMVAGAVFNKRGKKDGKVIACNGRKGLALVPVAEISQDAELDVENGKIKVTIPAWWPSDMDAARKISEQYSL